MACFFCTSFPTHELIYEYTYRRVILGENQSYLGRSLVVSKRHCTSISELTYEERKELYIVIQQFERVMSRVFGASHYNRTCLLNDAYKAPLPEPHLHRHCRPRYRQSVVFDGEMFTDHGFGHHYDKNSKKDITLVLRRSILKTIQLAYKSR